MRKAWEGRGRGVGEPEIGYEKVLSYQVYQRSPCVGLVPSAAIPRSIQPDSHCRL